MIRGIGGFVFGAAFAVVALTVGLALGPSPAEPSLADRVRDACRPGYTAVDWTAHDVMGYLPEGSVLVTCKNFKTADIYPVAVQR